MDQKMGIDYSFYIIENNSERQAFFGDDTNPWITTANEITNPDGRGFKMIAVPGNIHPG